MSDDDQGRQVHTGGGAYVEGGVDTGGAPFIGRDQINSFQVQVHVVEAVDQRVRPPSFVKEHAPYKGPYPYERSDGLLFSGRGQEIEHVVNRIRQQRTLVIHGEADVGKTSLLAAGVVPRLVQDGTVVIELRDYGRPVDLIRAKLVGYASGLGLNMPDDPTLAHLVRTIGTAQGQDLVLILDQFERFFTSQVQAGRRRAFLDALAETVEPAEPPFLRVIISIRDDALGPLGDFESILPDLWRRSLPLYLLERDQAREAIERPLYDLDYKATFVEDVVESRLLPDLEDLAWEDPGVIGPVDSTRQESKAIRPADLQIVCSRLYEAALTRRPQHISQRLYDEVGQGKGAAGIVASYLEDRLRTKLAEHSQVAWQILGAMADPDLRYWIPADSLHLRDVDRDALQGALQALVEAELLIWRQVRGRYEYAFANHSVSQAALRLAGEEARHRYRAKAELRRVWEGWLAHDALANRGQLRRLADSSEDLSLRPVQLLLLLRSAVAQDEPLTPWLSLLDAESSHTLIRQLEEPTRASEPADGASQPRFSQTTLGQARLLLGLYEESDQQIPSSPDYGPVALRAASHDAPSERATHGQQDTTQHRDRVTPQTCALALAVAYEQGALKRIDAALAASGQGRARRLELRGALADASPPLAAGSAGLPPGDRLGVWWWRCQRRVIRGRHYISALLLGGILGAGLGLGSLRGVMGAAISALIREPGSAGVHFAISSYWGWILGCGITLGMVLANAVRLKPVDLTKVSPTERPPAVLVTALGTLAFSLAYLVNFWLDGGNLLLAPLALPLAVVAGLALSAALCDRPSAGRSLGLGGWVLRVGAVSSVFALTQLAFVAAKDKGVSLTVVWDGGFYRGKLGGLLEQWAPQLVHRYPAWPDYLAVVDAALVGTVLVLSITAGWIVAIRQYKKWRAIIDRVSD